MLEGEFVYQCSVGAEWLLIRSFEVELFDEVPVVGGAATLEEVGEGGAGVALGVVAAVGELGEGCVVGLDGCVGGF